MHSPGRGCSPRALTPRPGRAASGGAPTLPVTRRALALAELRRRLALLPDVEVFALTRPGLAPEVVVERVEHLVAERPPGHDCGAAVGAATPALPGALRQFQFCRRNRSALGPVGLVRTRAK